MQKKMTNVLKLAMMMTLPIKALLLFNSNFLSSCLLGIPLHCTALLALHRAGQLGKRWIASNCVRLHYRELVSKLHYRKLVSKVKLPSKEFHQIFSCPPQLQNFCFTKNHEEKNVDCRKFTVYLQLWSFHFLSLFICLDLFLCLCYFSGLCLFHCLFSGRSTTYPSSSSPSIIDSRVCIVSYHFVSVFSFVCVWGDLRLTLPSSSPPIMVSWGSSLPPPSSPPPITINRNP